MEMHATSHNEQDPETGYWRVVCDCGWKSKWEYFLGHSKMEWHRHVDSFVKE